MLLGHNAFIRFMQSLFASEPQQTTQISADIREKVTKMNITVVGSGNVGSALLKQLTAAGHQVTLTARDLDKAAAVAKSYPGSRVVEAAKAAEGAQLIILATPYDNAVEALNSLGNLQGKVVVDVTNPLSADYMSLTVSGTTSAAEEIARALPGVAVVKAFNTLFAQVLSDGPQFADGQRATVFYAGDDNQAKQQVAALAGGLGFHTQDAGGLKNARYLEPLAGLNIYLGYGAGLGTQIAPTWISR